jgi:maleylacetate reductase
VALDIALKNPYWNPRPLERAALQAVLEAAYEGRRPD